MTACALAGVVVRAQDRPRTTTEIVQLALDENLDLQAARQQVEEAKGRLRQAGVRLSPTLVFDGATARPFGTPGEDEFSVGYVQPIELAGKRQKRTLVGVDGVAVAENELEERTRQLVFDVKTRIAEFRAAQAKAEALTRLLAMTQESEHSTSARVAEGDAAPLEEQLLVTELARIQAQRTTFAGRASSALIDLRRTVGGTSGPGLTVAAAPPAVEREWSLNDLTSRALASRADLRAARGTEAQTLAGVALARADGVPDLTASAGYTSRTSTFGQLFGVTSDGRPSPLVNHDQLLSVGVSIPIFTGRHNQGAVEAATARATAARLERQSLEATIPLEVEAGYQRWVSARATVDLIRHGVLDQSAKNLEVMRQAYTLGQLRLLDVLNEQRQLADSELTFIDAEAELAEAWANLERLVGADLS
jgi:cobalt-zinc-cadmium efflux system outer membrane protein